MYIYIIGACFFCTLIIIINTKYICKYILILKAPAVDTPTFELHPYPLVTDGRTPNYVPYDTCKIFLATRGI